MSNILEGKTAIITGAGSGIGQDVALALMQDGYHVALVGRRADALATTATAAADLPGKPLAIPADISDPAAVDHRRHAVDGQ